MTASDGPRTIPFLRSIRVLGAVALLAVLPCRRFYAQDSGPAAASAQTDARAPMNFDVVSVKRHQPGDREARMQTLPDGIRLINVPLLDVVREAYGLTFNGQLVGVPEWMTTERFDIEEKVAPADVEAFRKLPLDRVRLMARPMLASRFKLAVRQDTRTLPVYALVQASGSLKMKASAPADAYPDGLISMRQETLPTGARPSEMTGQGVTMERLAKMLSRPEVGRMIVDKTGLKGTYDFKLSWTSEALSTDAAPDSANPTLFTALQEQLGLKLQPEKDAVPVIVIEHVEMPSDN